MAPKIKNFTKRGAQLRAASLKWSRKVAAERQALGLTTRGTVRKVRQWPALHGRPDREQHLRRNAIYRHERSQGGLLTVKGTARKNYLWPELAGLTGAVRERVRCRLWHQNKVRRQRAALLALPKTS